jgi:F1F0 ATPase subunit 2
MNDATALLLAGAAGIILGTIFFGGLWWTVRQGISSKRASVWFASSLLLRIAIVLSGLYLVGGRDWRRLALCLVGFALARLAVLALTRSSPLAQPSQPAKASHAP